MRKNRQFPQTNETSLFPKCVGPRGWGDWKKVIGRGSNANGDSHWLGPAHEGKKDQRFFIVRVPRTWQGPRSKAPGYRLLPRGDRLATNISPRFPFSSGEKTRSLHRRCGGLGGATGHGDGLLCYDRTVRKNGKFRFGDRCGCDQCCRLFWGSAAAMVTFERL